MQELINDIEGEPDDTEKKMMMKQKKPRLQKFIIIPRQSFRNFRTTQAQQRTLILLRSNHYILQSVLRCFVIKQMTN